MLFSSRRLILLHVPKTGGNSIQSVLQPYSDDRLVVKHHRDGIDRFDIEGPVTPFKHATLADYAERMHLADLSIAITVRHPVQRLVSFYFSPSRWMVRAGDGWAHRPPVWSIEDFRAVAAKITPAASFLMLNGATQRPDMVLRHERLDQGFRKLLERFDFRSDLALPHRNASQAPREMFEIALTDPEVRRIAESRLAADFETFGYR